jgi:hypothetical protein
MHRVSRSTIKHQILVRGQAALPSVAPGQRQSDQRHRQFAGNQYLTIPNHNADSRSRTRMLTRHPGVEVEGRAARVHNRPGVGNVPSSIRESGKEKKRAR